MLAIPEKGMVWSVKAHNVRLDIVCDWIEGSALFDDDEVLSAADVVDSLCDNEVYASQDFAWELVSNAWREIDRRLKWIGEGTLLRIEGLKIRRVQGWREKPAHSFCVMLALCQWYSSWAQQFGSNFNEQGHLFERLASESLQIHFPDWRVHLTGWTGASPKKLVEIVEEVASLVGESIGDIKRWMREGGKDEGLDVLFLFSFEDERAGIPVYLMQCASGGDWEDKLHTPRLRVWTKVINFASDPKKAFSLPYALLDDEFMRVCNIVNGVLMDRYRILSAGRSNTAWISKNLSENLVEWLEPRLKKLPRDDP